MRVVRTAKELAHRLTHHLDEEEHEVFQVAGKALKETEKDEFGASYQGDMARRRAET